MKNKVEIHNDQEAVIRRIEQLKETGFHDTDMYVIAKGEQSIDNIKGSLETLTDEAGAGSGTLWDKFRNLVGAEAEVESAFSRLGMEEEDLEVFTSAIENGKLLLIIAINGL